MQSGVLEWILEQKEDTNGETGEIQKLWSLVNDSIPMLVSSFGQRYHGTSPNGGNQMGSIQELYVLSLSFLWNLQLFKKIKGFFSESIFM